MRILAATNQNLRTTVRNGTFREDLYYRLGIVEIEIPPLREREEDILPLARFFLKRISRKLKLPPLTLDADCLDALLSYPWPGNVRELENAMERAAVYSRDSIIHHEHLPPSITNPDQHISTRHLNTKQTLKEVEHQHILSVLDSVQQNKSKAAKILGISPATLWRKLKEE